MNADKPGYIGRLGTTLGEAGVNIATFSLGRTAPGEDAVALVGVDQTITDNVLETVAALSEVIEARPLAF